MTDAAPLLEVENLKTHFFLRDRVIPAVDGVSFSVPRGKTVCVVGESGSGKSITARSILGLVDPPGRIVGGHIWWHGEQPREPAKTRGQHGQALDLAAIPPRSEQMRRIRGAKISMVFQEPMASLSPMYTIGAHLVEAIRLHSDLSKRDAWKVGVELLDKVGIRSPEQRMKSYSFQLSGGMCQRAMIAIALCCRPALLIADEPTTALDVTTQSRILSLLRNLQAENGMTVLFITHDLGVVAEIADQVVVMRHGQVMETGPVDQIFHSPEHPYTRQLLAAIPKMTRFESLVEAPR